MITDIEILGLFYKILNVPAITSIINGEIWKIAKPVGRELEDIVINMLTNSQATSMRFNNGIININSFTIETQTHEPDSLRLKQINDLIISELNFENGKSIEGQLDFRLISQKTFRDNDNNLMYYSNLKIEYSYKQ